MKKKIWIIAIAVLLAATAFFAVIHLTGRTAPDGNSILINNTAVVIDEKALVAVEGTIINGKGEEKKISGQGVLLSSLIGDNFSSAKITADDEYSATVTTDDISNAYILVKDGEYRLIVFGDSNSKRDVKNVIRIDFE